MNAPSPLNIDLARQFDRLPPHDIETEKVTTEVAAPCDGRLVEILAAVDAIVEVGGAVCKIET